MADILGSFGNLEIVEVKGKQVFRCRKCGYVLCPIIEDYKIFVLRNEAPISKGQPAYLASETDRFILREYYCPQCALMFEVNMVAKDEKRIWSPRLKGL